MTKGKIDAIGIGAFGPMEQKQLFPMVRSQVRDLLSGYLDVPAITHDIDYYIVPPMLNGKAGLAGTFALTAQALGSKNKADRVW